MNWSIFMTLARLTFRQVATVKRGIIVALLIAIPVVGSVLISYFNATENTAAVIFDFGIFSTVLPIVTLVIASPAFADEIEDRTLAILTLAPISRWLIVTPKLLTVAVIATVPMVIASFASAAIASDINAMSSAVAVSIGTAFGCVCYAALFTFLGSITGRSIIIGLLYVLAWENLFVTFIPTLSYTSVSQWSVAVASQIEPYILALDDFGSPVSAGLPAIAYALVAGVVLVIGCYVANVRRLRTMDVN